MLETYYRLGQQQAQAMVTEELRKLGSFSPDDVADAGSSALKSLKNLSDDEAVGSAKKALGKAKEWFAGHTVETASTAGGLAGAGGAAFGAKKYKAAKAAKALKANKLVRRATAGTAVATGLGMTALIRGRAKKDGAQPLDKEGAYDPSYGGAMIHGAGAQEQGAGILSKMKQAMFNGPPELHGVKHMAKDLPFMPTGTGSQIPFAMPKESWGPDVGQAGLFSQAKRGYNHAMSEGKGAFDTAKDTVQPYADKAKDLAGEAAQMAQDNPYAAAGIGAAGLGAAGAGYMAHRAGGQRRAAAAAAKAAFQKSQQMKNYGKLGLGLAAGGGLMYAMRNKNEK